jgi:hypothetical protein
MAAGDISYILGFVYKSDDDTPIAAGDPIYYFGLPVGKVEFAHPMTVLGGTTWWSADSAQPAGFEPKLYYIEGEVKMTVLPVDLIPFYLALGGTPDLDSSIFTVAGSTSGSVPSLVFHKENNELANEQAKEYYDCRCKQLDLKLVDGDLATTLSFVVEREYNMTSDSVVRQTGTPKLRGSVASGTYKTPTDMIAYGKLPYPVHSNVNGHSVTWNSKTLPYLQDVKFSIKNAQNPRRYSATNWATIQNKGKREFSDLTMTFAVKPLATNDLDDMEAYVRSKATSDLVWQISRRHANDIMKLTFDDAYLKSWEVLPTPQGQEYESIIVGVWQGITDVHAYDRSVLANGNADAMSADDVESAT